MNPPPAVIVPLGVPREARGLGLGFAALLHQFSRVRGEPLALAHLMAREQGKDEQGPQPVESFVGPDAWRALTQKGDAHADYPWVISGAFLPPGDGPGALQLVAYATSDGKQVAGAEAPIDPESAGRGILDAVREFYAALGGDISPLFGIADFAWDPFESLLRGERCQLLDPLSGASHDPLAALLHFERAVAEAPHAPFAASRLASLALAMGHFDSAKVRDACLRSIERSLEDAPELLELHEARNILLVRSGQADQAEPVLLESIGRFPEHGRFYALLAATRRARGDLAGARAALDVSALQPTSDPMILTELGIVHRAFGELTQARAAWGQALDQRPLFGPAFQEIARVAIEQQDRVLGELLVDRALESGDTHADVLREAVGVLESCEPEGLARSARLKRLAERHIAQLPGDPWGHFTLGRATQQLEETDGAIVAYRRAEAMGRHASLGVQAQRMRYSLENPCGSSEALALLQAADRCAEGEIETIVSRAQRLSSEPDAWAARLSLAILARRRGLLEEAEKTLASVLQEVPGATRAVLEVAEVSLLRGDLRRAVLAAARARDLGGCEMSMLDRRLEAALARNPSSAPSRSPQDLPVNSVPPSSLWSRIRLRFRTN